VTNKIFFKFYLYLHSLTATLPLGVGVGGGHHILYKEKINAIKTGITGIAGINIFSKNYKVWEEFFRL